MNVLVLVLLLAAWEDFSLALQTTDRLRPLRRWLHKRQAIRNTRVDNSFDRTSGKTYGQAHLTLRPSTNTQSAEADTRAGTAKVTIVNSTGPLQPSKTYTYPFGRERTQYVYGSPENNSQSWVSGGGSASSGASRAQRLVAIDGSSREARRPSPSQQGALAYDEERRQREEESSAFLKEREELHRRRQEIDRMKQKQSEEEEEVRKEEAEQRRRQREETIRRRNEEEAARRRKQEEQRRLQEERRKQTREPDNVGSESRQVYEERRRNEDGRRRQEEQRRVEEEKRREEEEKRRQEEERRIEEERVLREEERRRRHQEQQRRRQQANPQTTTQNYGFQTPRPTPGDTWRRSRGSGGSSYPRNQNFPSGSAQGWDQQTGHRYGDPRVVVGGARDFGTQYENSQVNDNQEDTSECPDVGVEMRINGLDCQNAIRTFGSYLCYSHEFTSKQCCQICKKLKQTTKVGCEYGDHVDNCKILTPSDCYDLRNKHSCCATCERFKRPYAPAGCEYGDNVDRCDSVRQNPGLCYVPNNHRSCCDTCNQIKNTSNPSCAYGDYIPSLCQTYDANTSGVKVNCYSPHRRKICCQTCERIREWASIGMPADCQYGDRPISFYYPQYGRLTCSTMFQFIDVSECRTNPVVATNCCYTCNRYINNRG